MKKTLFVIAAILGLGYVAYSQEKPRQKRPVTQKQDASARVKSEPTEEGMRNRQIREEEINKRRAEKRAKMEQAKKDIRDRIASDTVSAKK